MPDSLAIETFGSNYQFDHTTKKLTIDLNDFTDAGDIADNLGLDITGITAANIDNYASKLRYALILLWAQKQAEDGANDPTLKTLITQGGLRIATGARQGQLQRVFSFNLYTEEASLNNVIDIDNV